MSNSKIVFYDFHDLVSKKSQRQEAKEIVEKYCLIFFAS